MKVINSTTVFKIFIILFMLILFGKSWGHGEMPPPRSAIGLDIPPVMIKEFIRDNLVGKRWPLDYEFKLPGVQTQAMQGIGSWFGSWFTKSETAPPPPAPPSGEEEGEREGQGFWGRIKQSLGFSSFIKDTYNAAWLIHNGHFKISNLKVVDLNISNPQIAGNQIKVKVHSLQLQASFNINGIKYENVDFKFEAPSDQGMEFISNFDLASYPPKISGFHISLPKTGAFQFSSVSDEACSTHIDCHDSCCEDNSCNKFIRPLCTNPELCCRQGNMQIGLANNLFSGINVDEQSLGTRRNFIQQQLTTFGTMIKTYGNKYISSGLAGIRSSMSNLNPTFQNIMDNMSYDEYTKRVIKLKIESIKKLLARAPNINCRKIKYLLRSIKEWNIQFITSLSSPDPMSQSLYALEDQLNQDCKLSSLGVIESWKKKIFSSSSSSSSASSASVDWWKVNLDRQREDIMERAGQILGYIEGSTAEYEPSRIKRFFKGIRYQGNVERRILALQGKLRSISREIEFRGVEPVNLDQLTTDERFANNQKIQNMRNIISGQEEMAELKEFYELTNLKNLCRKKSAFNLWGLFSKRKKHNKLMDNFTEHFEKQINLAQNADELDQKSIELAELDTFLQGKMSEYPDCDSNNYLQESMQKLQRAITSRGEEFGRIKPSIMSHLVETSGQVLHFIDLLPTLNDDCHILGLDLSEDDTSPPCFKGITVYLNELNGQLEKLFPPRGISLMIPLRGSSTDIGASQVINAKISTPPRLIRDETSGKYQLILPLSLKIKGPLGVAISSLQEVRIEIDLIDNSIELGEIRISKEHSDRGKPIRAYIKQQVKFALTDTLIHFIEVKKKLLKEKFKNLAVHEIQGFQEKIQFCFKRN